jgi:hypothetical protein
MPLHESRSKELFSEAYVRAVVSAARMHVEPRAVDVDGIDGYIHYTGQIGDAYSPQIGFQLKCTSVAAHVKADHIAYPLDVANYNQLRVTNVGVPRILIVVVVPEQIAAWVLHDEAQLRIFRCGYWVSLRGEPGTMNTVRKTVHVPRAQQLTVPSLRAIMHRMGQGFPP